MHLRGRQRWSSPRPPGPCSAHRPLSAGCSRPRRTQQVGPTARRATGTPQWRRRRGHTRGTLPTAPQPTGRSPVVEVAVSLTGSARSRSAASHGGRPATAGAATGGVPLDGRRPFVSLLGVILEHAALPKPLVRAHAEGRLVLFVGAGVSADSPSDLPLFGDLAARVADPAGAPPGDAKHDAPEALLEAIASSGVEVHAIVHKMISESALPNTTHEAVAALPLAGQVIQIVTTNYDRHLSACLPEETPLFEAPNLPAEVDFTGERTRTT